MPAGTILYVEMATFTGSLDKPLVAGPPLGALEDLDQRICRFVELRISPTPANF